MSARKDLGRKLGAARGRRYWRSLEELAGTEAFQELMRREFPEQASVWPEALSRRQFLTLMGASLALAGVSGCSVRPAPSTEIVPYVRQPEEIVPGRPLFYATAMTLGGGIGLLVESHEGRPTKVEGNPDHPASLGATDAFCQAAVLELYDPDRSQTVTYLGQTRTRDDATNALRAAAHQRGGRGRGLRVLTETVFSPTQARLLEDLLRKYPEAKWHQYEPVNRDAAFRAARAAFGGDVETRYDLGKADVVLCLDADLFTHGAASLRHVADFMARRRVRTAEQDAAGAKMNRLYVVETEVTCTGAKADHRLALPASEVERFARALAADLGVAGAPAAAPGPWGKWVAAVAKDLRANRGRCVVIPGDRQPAAVHLLAHVLNDHLGNTGQTVLHTDPVAARPVDQAASLRELSDEMERGGAEVLLILGGNPVYTAPADLRFAERMQKVPLRFHLGLYQDETSRLCHWHLPEAHFLEAWGDTRAFDGTASIVQPLIAPLYRGESAIELLSLLTDESRLTAPGYEIVRDHWRRRWQEEKRSGDFETFWMTSVHDGVVADTALPPKSVSLRRDWQDRLGDVPAASPGAESLEIVFRTDPTVYDGRFANNGWLQELPKPLTKLTWDNAALLSPNTARSLGLAAPGSYAHGGEHGGFRVPVVELTLGERKVRAPVWVMPGHADGAVTVHLGYGRTAAGKVGGDVDHTVGFDAYPLRTSERPWFAPGLAVAATGESYPLACTQEHHLMEGREPVRAGTLDEYRRNPHFAAEREAVPEETARARRPLTMYPPRDPGAPGHKWGMVIDLTTCVGCNACVTACQAENNIPVVGKDQVLAGREMHWLRVDRYLGGKPEDPGEFYFQPLPCMHCEYAPCEYVCPVAATVHSADGLNDMVYNRCVGTRFCQNNCPYKVRRFNFFSYADFTTEPTRLQYNPDVTVRSRGVMEKCTYCVQRIRQAEIAAGAEGRPVRDGEILTACQAACPAQAIVFGDLNDDKSTVRRWKDTPLEYGLLADLNTEPRTRYLAALRNPNPEFEAD